MRHVTFGYKGKKYGLLYTALAMFELEEEFSSLGTIVEVINNQRDILNESGEKTGSVKLMNKVEELNAFCRFAEVMSIQSSNVRADLGYPRTEIIEKDILCRSLSPLEFLRLKLAVINAINEGNRLEVTKDEEDIDLGLLEIQKKTDKTE